MAQKEKQMKEDLQEQILNIKRYYVNARVDEAARSSKLKDQDLISAVRREVLKA
jgi:ribosomal protein L29